MSDYSEYLYKLPDSVMTLRQMAEIDDLGVSVGQLMNWEEKHKTNGFPEPYSNHGRYRLYDLRDVSKWVAEHKQITQQMRKNVDNMNNGRHGEGNWRRNGTRDA
jgi:hypothetical protein